MNVSPPLSPRIPSSLPRPLDRAVRERERKGARWVWRRIYRYQPSAVLALFAFLVGAPLALDWFPWFGHKFDHVSERHPVAIDLTEHVLVALLVAAAAYWWVLGRKRQRALRKYRRLARDRPGELVEWSQGRVPLARRKMSRLLADGIERSNKEPAVAVVKGRAGTGRTSFLVGLVEDLANKNLIPIPVLASRDDWLDIHSAAREMFFRHIDDVLSSEHEADEIWHRAQSTRDVVILVDGLNDEVVDSLWQDGGQQFRAMLKGLRARQISIVLATTRELPLKDIKPLREDLDLLSREEADDYVRDALSPEKDDDAIDQALASLKPLRDPVDGFLIAPFYLDVVVSLSRPGLLDGPSEGHRDRWRDKMTSAYIAGIEDGNICPSEDISDPESGSEQSRGGAALEVARTLASEFADQLGHERPDMTVLRTKVCEDKRQLTDAADLNLVWHGAEGIGFASDDLGAYLVAAQENEPDRLLKNLREIAARADARPRRDRLGIVSVIFWHLQNRDRAEATFERVLELLEDGGSRRPGVVAAAVRIASSCTITRADYRERLAAMANLCIDRLDSSMERAAQPTRAAELLRLVRALAEWPAEEAHHALWRLATNLDVEVEWPAAKALAMADGSPAENLRGHIEKTLSRAEGDPFRDLSKPSDIVGNEIASLAWILPSLRTSSAAAEEYMSRTTKLCLNPKMSPLRGEMSLAQGLKLAVLNGREASNVEHIKQLLLDGEEGLRFWHARLVLVQALVANAWRNPDVADDLDRQLGQLLRSREQHPLVRRGIKLSRDGLRDLRSSGGNEQMTRYVWTHERDAVKWVEQGKGAITQLAGDAVLLSNMIYGLRKDNPAHADKVAADATLPSCIRNCGDRQNIINGCSCARGLCREGEPAIVATRARFSESFCREQARLALWQPPRWTKPAKKPPYGRKRRLESFWDQQANIARDGRHQATSDRR